MLIESPKNTTIYSLILYFDNAYCPNPLYHALSNETNEYAIQ